METRPSCSPLKLLCSCTPDCTLYIGFVVANEDGTMDQFASYHPAPFDAMNFMNAYVSEHGGNLFYYSIWSRLNASSNWECMVLNSENNAV
jgi:hypothetical protein